MYFWNTKLVVDALKSNSINELGFKNYLLANSIVTLVGYYLTYLQPRESSTALAIEAIGAIAITVLGLNAAFAANGGTSGINFLNRFVAISFPLTIKVVVAGFAVGIVQGILGSLGASQTQLEWVSAIALLFILIVMYWRLITHVRNVNA